MSMITIDGIEYQIPYKVVSRKADMLFKSAERTEDGVLHSSLIGVYYNFELAMGGSANNEAAYSALWLKITEPVESHIVSMPDDNGAVLTFSAYFASIKDEVARHSEDVTIYKNLTFSVIATSPARVP